MHEARHTATDVRIRESESTQSAFGTILLPKPPVQIFSLVGKCVGESVGDWDVGVRVGETVGLPVGKAVGDKVFRQVPPVLQKQ